MFSKIRGTFHQLTTSSTSSLSSMSMASSSSGPKRFSSRIQVTDSSRRARVSSIRTTSSPADVNQQLAFRNLLQGWGEKKNTKLSFSLVFYIFWENCVCHTYQLSYVIHSEVVKIPSKSENQMDLVAWFGISIYLRVPCLVAHCIHRISNLRHKLVYKMQ